MKKKKKILLIIVVIVIGIIAALIFLLNPFGAYYKYELMDNNEYKLVSHKRTILPCEEEVEIPAEYKGKKVSALGTRVFGSDLLKIKKITIPNTIKFIENGVFAGSADGSGGQYKQELVRYNIYYNGTIEDWCNIQFESCTSNPSYNAKNIYMLDKNNEYVNCNYITIPESITKIGDYQFYGFINMYSLTLSKNITEIGKEAFTYCNKLIEVHNFSTLDIEKLSSIHFYWRLALATSNIFRVQDFLFYTMWNSSTLKNDFYLLGYDGESDRIILPSHLEVTNDMFTYYSISSYAFYGSNLVSIEIKDGINECGSSSFNKCDDLEILILYNQIKYCSLLRLSDYSPKCILYIKGTGIPQEWEIDDKIINKVYYYYDAKPNGSGNYWHYVDGVPAKW